MQLCYLALTGFATLGARVCRWKCRQWRQSQRL